MADIQGVGFIYGTGFHGTKHFRVGSPALGSGITVLATKTDTGANQTFTTGITNPDVPRTIVMTPGGTTANVTAVSNIIVGTDINDQALTETAPAFTAGAATAVTTLNAFKTVTSITQVANGSAVTIAYTCGSAIGLPERLSYNTVEDTHRNSVKESTAPTVVVDANNVGKNLITLSSALNGTPIDVFYHRS